mgnify:CR=1 FL=1
MKPGTRETISIAPKPTPPAYSWWAGSYPTRESWYAVAQREAGRLHKSKPVTASIGDTGKFGDYWKKPRQEDIARFDDNTAQVA